MKQNRLNSLFIAIALLFFVSACASRNTVQGEGEDYSRIKTIAVLPPEGSGPNPELTAGAEVLSSLLAEYFQDRPEIKLVDHDLQDGLRLSSGNVLVQARAVGRELGTDAVLMTTVNRFVERVGSRYSAERTASVAFDFRLVDVASGQTLWFGAHDETQKTVMENIFLLGRAAGRGFKFVTAAELAREGVASKLGGTPYFQGNIARGQ